VSTKKRSVLVLAAVVLAAIALAAVVATRAQRGGATTLGTYGGNAAGPAVLADTTAQTPTDAGEVGVIDPAKQSPSLDKFHSKDPFVQINPAPATGAGGGVAPSPAPSGGTQANPTAANIKVNGTTYTNRKVGAKLPPSKPAFKVSALSPSGVTFQLLNGYALPDGTASFDVAENETVKVTLKKGTTTSNYNITVVKLIYGGTTGGGGTAGGGGTTGGGGTGGGGTLAGHSIRVVSIDTQNGVAVCTLVVDGRTYANKQTGSVFTTGWGQIKILGINAAAQTVTILHGDQQITLHVGQSWGK
jgi:hypothetical protein